jgi:hypothetical protein
MFYSVSNALCDHFDTCTQGGSAVSGDLLALLTQGQGYLYDKSCSDVTATLKSIDFPKQFQGYVMEPVPENMFRGMNLMNAFPPVMEGLFKMQGSNQIGTRRYVAARGNWKCSVCRFASFDTFEEALAHENNCNGFPEGNICRARAAYNRIFSDKCIF